MTFKDAAMKIADDFGLEYKSEKYKPPQKPIKSKKTLEQEFREAQDYCFKGLSDYLHLLKEWKIKYAPKSMDEEWHPLFDIVNIGLHFFHKDVRLYAASCSEV